MHVHKIYSQYHADLVYYRAFAPHCASVWSISVNYACHHFNEHPTLCVSEGIWCYQVGQIDLPADIISWERVMAILRF